jgi:maleylpyruvate isomerase
MVGCTEGCEEQGQPAMNELDRDVAGAAAAHQGLLVMLDDALDRVDPAAPSRLPEWTVGHVLTHLARNADSIVRALTAAECGEVVDRYEGGGPGRNAEIEAGRARPAAVQVDDVRRTIWRLEQVWAAQTNWDGRSRETSGLEIPVRDLPFRRWREVEVHRVDLGLGYEAEDWPDEYVRLELRNMEMLWNARRPMGLTGLPPEALAVPPRTRLAWLLGRTDIPGLEHSRIL